MKRWLVLIAAPAALAAGVDGVPGDVAQLVAGVAAAVLATAGGLRHVGAVRRWLTLGLWSFALADLVGIGNDEAGLPLALLGLVAMLVAGLIGVRRLGRQHSWPLLRDAAWAAVAVTALTLDVDRLDGEHAVLLVSLGLLVVLATVWLQLAVVRRTSGTVTVLLCAAVAAMTVGSVMSLVAEGSVVGGIGVGLGVLARVVFGVVLGHDDVHLLFRDGDVGGHEVVASRAVIGVTLLTAVAAVSRVRELTGPVPSWQVVLPVFVLATTAVSVWRLYRVAQDDNRALRRATHRDPVTDLLNEEGVLEVLHDPASVGEVVVVVEVQGLRTVLRRLGGAEAGRLARSLGRRLAAALEVGARVGRTDTDEFVVVTAADPTAVADAVRAVVEETVQAVAASVSVRLGVRAGWAAVGTTDPGEALVEARFATDEAAVGEVVQVTDDRRERFELQRVLVRDFPCAVASGQVVPHFQPILDVASGAVSSFEVLSRWTHPTLGPISPGAFVPLAESSGAIVQLGELVIEEGCHQLARWRALPGHEGLGIAVNVSPQHLVAGSLQRTVAAALAAADLPGEALTLELTEDVLVELDQLGGVLAELRATGVRIAVDDFGTGYSSMAYLDQLRPDVVKVDRRFTRTLATGEADVALGIFALLEQLDLPVVAEGVEDLDTLVALRAARVRLWQGFLCSPALPAAEATALLAADHPRPVTGAAVPRAGAASD